jgi:hypothetical protein
MYFELYPGLWISDYKSYPILKKFKIDAVINFSKHKINKAIDYTRETLPETIHDYSSKNLVILISNESQLKYIARYLILYAKVDEVSAWNYIHNKYFL